MYIRMTWSCNPKALTYGALSRMKIDNMRREHQEKLIKDAEKLAQQQKKKEEAKTGRTGRTCRRKKDMAFISVSIGEGSMRFSEASVSMRSSKVVRP